MKLVELVNSQEAFRSLLGMKLNGKLSLKLIRLNSKVSEELKLFDELRMRLFKEMGNTEKDEKGRDVYKVEGEVKIALEKELESALNTDVALIVEKLKGEELGDNEIKPVHLIQLSWLIDTNE